MYNAGHSRWEIHNRRPWRFIVEGAGERLLIDVITAVLILIPCHLPTEAAVRSCVVVGPAPCLIVDNLVETCPRSEGLACWCHDHNNWVVFLEVCPQVGLASCRVEVTLGDQVEVTSNLEMAAHTYSADFGFAPTYFRYVVAGTC
jgi:hypothetical protein